MIRKEGHYSRTRSPSCSRSLLPETFIVFTDAFVSRRLASYEAVALISLACIFDLLRGSVELDKNRFPKYTSRVSFSHRICLIKTMCNRAKTYIGKWSKRSIHRYKHAFFLNKLCKTPLAHNDQQIAWLSIAPLSSAVNHPTATCRPRSEMQKFHLRMTYTSLSRRSRAQ